jgi:hypothetical protein
MTSKRVKKRAKHIKNDRKLKRDLAEFLVMYTATWHHININDVLLNGHRGFLSMSEEELIKKFDSAYIDLKQICMEMSKSGEWKELTDCGWSPSKLEITRAALSTAESIYNKLFEEIVL